MNIEKVAKIFVKGCLASMLLTFQPLGEVQGSKGENFHKNADSLLSRLLARPETRMKEIAPAESLFRETLAKYPEILSILRTNSKGFIVNALLRGDKNAVSDNDVSNEKYYSIPEKTMKPYHGQIVQTGGKNQYSLFCSKPIIVRNSSGMYRFGGVVVVHLSFTDSLERSVPVKKEKKAVRLSLAADSVPSSSSPGLQKKDTMPAPSSRQEMKDPATPPSSSRRQEENDTVFAPAATALAATALPPAHPLPDQPGADSPHAGKAGPGRILIISALSVVSAFFVMVLLIRRNTRAQRRRIGLAAQKPAILALGEDAAVRNDDRAIASEINQSIEQVHPAAESVPVQEESFRHLNVAVDHDETIALEGIAITPAEVQVMHAPSQDISIEPGQPSLSPDASDAYEPPEVITEVPEIAGADRDDAERLKEEIRTNLIAEFKKEIVEKEINVLRNSVISELKTDIRQKLEINEAEAIRTHLRQEMSDAWRREIQETYHESFCREEIENLRKIVREKLIEKEMPLLVKNHRIELSKEIRSKMEAAFSDQIERHERNVMKAEIVKKLQTEEYPGMFQDEREKLRMSLKAQIAEKETETIEGFLRGELADQLRIQIQSEAESIRSGLRKELADRIEGELVEREYEALVAKNREALKERIKKEIEDNELQAIHDELIAQATEEERTRINSEELGKIIETERNRIADQEAPQLREQVRLQLREQELEAMHARVKKEIFAETSQAIRETCEQEYAGLLEKKMVEYRKMIEQQLHAEIKKDILADYHTLTDDLERLAGSMGSVEALDSLARTVTLLSDEKKKYKYFNLNSAQTESLLEYLKRVQGRFNIFLDKIDEALREMELKVRSVMNKLDDGA